MAASVASRRLVRGFTLLEVMMVVLIVGIISGAVLLALNPGGAERHLDDESERLAALIELAGNEAVMQNREYGLKLAGNGYAFLCFDETARKWAVCKDDDSLRPRQLPDGLEIHLLQESRMRLPTADSGKAPAQKALTPDILLLSSGEASPASLEIHVTDKPSLRAELRVDAVGRVSRDGGDGAGGGQ
jgi:general secretion pathway protein H